MADRRTERDGAPALPGYRPDEPAFRTVRMRLPPPCLIAEGNSACGGMNVGFGGIDRRG